MSDQVYDYLSDQFERGELGYGDRLNIKQIAKRLAMSTMPIRDAVKRLEQENIVTVNPRSHCVVRIPTKQDILDAIDARRMIEHFAVQSVHRHIRLEKLTELETIYERMSEISDEDAFVDETALKTYIDLDRRFHREICALAQNDYIIRFHRIVNMHLSMSFSYGIGVCHGIEATRAEHKAILDNLKAHSEEAVHVLDNHLDKSRSNIVKEESFRNLPD